MAKVRDYAKLAHDIKDAIGEENITSAAHCATRLRLVLKESPSAEITAQISSMPGVIQVMEKGGQYQIVIGTHAQDVYEEMAKLLHLDASQQPEVKQGLLNRVIATMSAVFAPFVYILAAAGLVQGCIGGAAGALVVALTGAKYYIYAGLPGLLTTVNTINASDPGSFTGEMIAVAVTIIVTIIMVQIIGCDEPGEKKSNT